MARRKKCSPTNWVRAHMVECLNCRDAKRCEKHRKLKRAMEGDAWWR